MDVSGSEMSLVVQQVASTAEEFSWVLFLTTFSTGLERPQAVYPSCHLKPPSGLFRKGLSCSWSQRQGSHPYGVGQVGEEGAVRRQLNIKGIVHGQLLIGLRSLINSRVIM